MAKARQQSAMGLDRVCRPGKGDAITPEERQKVIDQMARHRFE
jgi:hypothetical protein